MIEKAGPQDLAQLLLAMQQFYNEEGLTYDDARARRSLELLLTDARHGFVLIARQGAEIAAYAAVTHCFSLEFGGPFALLDEIFVLPAHRGQGLGQTLIQAVFDECRAQGFAAIRLEVEHENERAFAVYRKLGFAPHQRHLMTRWL
ncbi:MAG: GNAT family N-acetyltransferase [Bryobacterales bacterium]|nr:GNAT family N-acetyltransferase [Bryobacterales bacterium]